MNKRKYVFNFIYKNIWLVLTAVFINLLSGLVRTVGASFLKQITDAIGSKQIKTVLMMSSLGAAVMFSSYVFRWLGAVLSKYLSRKMAFETRINIISHLEKISFINFEAYKPGELQSIIENDTEEASNILYTVFSRIGNNLFLYVFSVIYMAKINPAIAVAALFITLSMGIINSRILKPIKKYTLKSREALGELSSVLDSLFKGANTIKTYNASSFAENAFSDAKDYCNKQVFLSEKADTVRFSLYNLVNDSLLIGSMIYLVYLGLHNQTSAGDAVVLIYLIKQILVPIEVVFRWMSRVVASTAAMERILSLINIKTESKSEKPAYRFAFEKLIISDISFSYSGNENMFKNCQSMTFYKNGIFFIKGESGKGKTTLLKLILGLYKSRTMKVKSLSDNNCVPLNGLCAFSSSDTELFPISIYENIALSNKDVSKEQCEKMLCRLGFKTYLDSLPNGIDTILSENASNMSGGQRQAVANARAFLSGKEIIILDEPFASLDSKSEIYLTDVINAEKKEKIIIITSHRSTPLISYDNEFIL